MPDVPKTVIPAAPTKDGPIVTMIAGFIGVVVVCALLGALLLISAVPTFLIWNWFMPYYFGVRSINFLDAVAIGIIIGYVKLKASDYTIKDPKPWGTFGKILMAEIFMLLLGWILHSMGVGV